MQECSSLTEINNAYHCQAEDAASDKEDYYEGLQGNKQLKPTLSTSLLKPGQQVRFSLPTKQSSQVSNSALTSATKVRML
jgi:hypothetical protein